MCAFLSNVFQATLAIMANQSSSSKVPGWVWLFTGTILGAFITFLMRLSELQPATPSIRPQPSATSAAENSKTPDKYDFYKILRDTEVPVTTTPQETVRPRVQENVDHFLQVASFRSAADAEQVDRGDLLAQLVTRHRLHQLCSYLHVL